MVVFAKNIYFNRKTLLSPTNIPRVFATQKPVFSQFCNACQHMVFLLQNVLNPL